MKRSHPSPQPENLSRSPRLNKNNNETQTERGHFSTPTSSVEQGRIRINKRKSVEEQSSLGETTKKEKRRKIQSQKHIDWKTYWVVEEAEIPPPDYFEDAPNMPSSKRARSELRNESESKSRCSSVTPQERRRRLIEHDVYTNEDRLMSTASRKLCDELLLGDRPPAGFPVYKAEKRHDVLQEAETVAEAIIQRDVLPIVVPSVVNLNRNGIIDLKHFGDEINAAWTKPMTMGGKHPKPDYVAALRRTPFDNETWKKLLSYATPENPVLLSPESCFPLVIAEAERGITGILEAEFQAVHAAAIAVKQQIHLFWAAYGKSDELVRELYGQALVFTVCHNHDDVKISAHYALFNEGTQDKLEFYRNRIANLSLLTNNGKDINRSKHVC